MEKAWYRFKRSIDWIWVCLLCVSVLLYGKVINVNAAGIDMAERNTVNRTVALELNSRNAQENIPFRVTNMFPGDSVTQDYRISVSYTGKITIYFRASVAEGEEALGEVLMVKVSLSDTGKLLYEGKLADMPAVEYEIATEKEAFTQELAYEVTVGLSTKVENEYQNKSLKAELSWWAEGAEAGGEKEPEIPTQPFEPSGEKEPDDPESKDEPQRGSLVEPDTGDDSRIILWLATAGVAMVVMLLLAAKKRRRMQTKAIWEQGEAVRETKSRRKLFWGILSVICLTVGLGITSLALVLQKVIVEENLFVTGQVKISLNDDQAVFREDIIFEPGMVVEKEFTLRNDSTCDVHYRLYFSNVEGEFAKVLQVQVIDEEQVIFEDRMEAMNGRKSEGAQGILQEGEERVMTIVFRVPEECQNEMQGRTIFFDLNADAVQAVNNPDGLFE